MNWVRPTAASVLLAAVFAALVIPADRFGLPQTAPSDILLALALVVGLIETGRRQETQPLRMLRSWPVLMGVIALTLAAVSAMNAADISAALRSLVRLSQIFVIFPLAFLLAIRSRTDLCLLQSMMALVIGGESALGIYQSLTGQGALYGGETIRAVGTFGAANINALAALAVLGLVLGLAGGQVPAVATRVAGTLLAALSLGAVVFSVSRGAWISAAAAALLVLSRIRLRRGLVVGSIGAIVAGIVLTLSAQTGGVLAERVTSIIAATEDAPDQAVIDRLALFGAARAMIEDHPWLGVGPGQFQMHRDGYASLALLGSSDIGGVDTFERQAILSPHNMYLSLGSELGILGAALLTTMMVATVVVGGLRLRRTPRTDALLWVSGAAACGGVLSVLINGLSGDFGGPGSVTIGWALGLVCWFCAQDRLQPIADGVEPVGSVNVAGAVRERLR